MKFVTSNRSASWYNDFLDPVEYILSSCIIRNCHILVPRVSLFNCQNWWIFFLFGIECSCFPGIIYITNIKHRISEYFVWYRIFTCQLRFYHLHKTMLAIVDTMISSRPWKLGHFYCCILFVLVYTCFQLIFVIGMKGENEVENK